MRFVLVDNVISPYIMLFSQLMHIPYYQMINTTFCPSPPTAAPPHPRHRHPPSPFPLHIIINLLYH